MWTYMNGERISRSAPNRDDLSCLGNPREGFKLYNAPYGTHTITCFATPISEDLAPDVMPTNWDGAWDTFTVVSAEDDPRPTWLQYRESAGRWPIFADLVVGDDTWHPGPFGSYYSVSYLGEELLLDSRSVNGVDEGAGNYTVTYLSQSWVLPCELSVASALREAASLARDFASDYSKRFLDESNRLLALGSKGKSRFELMGL